MLRRSWLVRLGTVATVAVIITGCKPSTTTSSSQPKQISSRKTTGDTSVALTVQSPAFAGGETIPEKYTGDGADVSPPLTFLGVPQAAKELALILDDPDAPTPQPWVHWIIFKIPVSATGLLENVSKTETLTEPVGARQGRNSFNRIGYGGPSPPTGHGVHHYHFKLYALDTVLEITATPDKTQLLSAMEGHVIAQGELVGTYQR